MPRLKQDQETARSLAASPPEAAGQAAPERTARDDLVRLASHDALTGLANRWLYQRTLDAALASGEPFAVLFLDLDDFKLVNDGFGHAPVTGC